MNATASDLYVASLLTSLFEAGACIQVLLGDADRAQYEQSRLARPAILRHLRTLCDSARDLPEPVRARLPRVDWQSWEELGDRLSREDEASRRLVWAALESWLPEAGLELRRYRQRWPELWRFTL
ncbi:uncharacterized protein with HEPN domain [Sphaerotilus hippei]|uniref:Uncharacterized protein with HEPN domain n=1 Tax=Sphaerotilus hippei TaxID=744406 RepID=A0A318GXA6_9BURK|nr:hypothetical protein [Sphaerotilus hippei]PXW94373.1 uncharacterized protein with HEPN domain [Sphaerotilus hippei]